MKRLFIPGYLILALQGQAAELSANSKLATDKSTPYAVTERGPHHNVWERTEYVSTPDGRQLPQTHSFTELGTGLNFMGQNGQYTESKAEIQILPNGAGAAATKGQHKVIFPANISDGQIEMNTPDNKWLRSRVLGLAFRDADGRSVLIAETKDSVGELHQPNVVIYPDAFNDLKADLRYTYRLAGFEQDIVLREQPPSPKEYGLNPETTKLEVLTEFFSPPTPEKRAQATNSVGDEIVDFDFGVMTIGQGKAFALGQEDAQQSGVPVMKSWEKMEGRDFLIEDVEFKAIEPKVRELPPAPTAMNRKPASPDAVLHRVADRRLLPEIKLARRQSTNTFQMAKADISTRPGYVLDYTVVNSQVGYTFRGDTTYFIPTAVFLSGAVTFEGGSVIKYAVSASVSLPPTVNWLATQYRPVILTARDDDSVGEMLPMSTHYPAVFYANPALLFNSGSPVIKNFRISYAQQAISAMYGSPYFYHGQIVNCANGITFGYGSAYLRNLLLANVTTALNNITYGAVSGQNVTVSGTANSTLATGYYSVNLVNSVLANVSSLGGSVSGNNNGFYNSPTFGTSPVVIPPSDPSPFQQVGGGYYYLDSINGYAFRNVGTTAIDATLLAELKMKTTCPPEVHTDETFSSPQTFAQRDIRDTDVPDLGYHYDPLDYAFGGCDADADLTFAAGTAVGWFRTSSGWYHAGHGIHIADQKIVTFDGRQEAPTYWVRCNTVQEQGGNAAWQGGFGPGGITGWGGQYQENPSMSPEIHARFLRCSTMANENGCHFRDDWGYLTVRARDCEFWGGALGGYQISCYLTNCLMERMYGGQVEGWNGNQFHLRNCTWRGGHMDLVPWRRAIPISVKDCVFDGTSPINVSDYGLNPGNASYDYNAFLTGSNRFPTTCGGDNDVFVSSFNWQTGPFGNYYLPADSTLTDEGSVNADVVGLFHFTTQKSQAKEANSPVDIGYHYVAVDLDTTGLVGFWPLDEGSGTIARDIAAPVSDGTLNNGPAWVSGRLGNSALSFDGVNDYVSVPNSTDLEVGKDGGNFSVSFWVQLKATATGSWRNLMHKGSDPQRTFAMWLHPSDNGLHYRISTTASSNEGGDSATALPLNQWVHVAYVKSGNKLRLYFNGIMDSEVTLAGASVSNTGPIYFGKDPSYPGTSCWLDDIRIYTRALTGPEISSLTSGVTSCRDSDGDNFPDYFEDRNGNGTVNSGETDWQTSGNGTTGTPGLKVFTPLY